MEDLENGLNGGASQIVTGRDTAADVGSGLVEAYSTPSLVTSMESASVAAIRTNLREGQTSVGIEVNRYLAPTLVGSQVLARAAVLLGFRFLFTDSHASNDRMRTAWTCRLPVPLNRLTGDFLLTRVLVVSA